MRAFQLLPAFLALALLPGCREEIIRDATALRIQALKGLPLEKKIPLTNHLPGIFGIPEVCAVFKDSSQAGGYLPTEMIQAETELRTLVCRDLRITLLPGSAAYLWSFRSGAPTIELEKGSALLDLAAGNFFLSTPEHFIGLRTKTPARLLLSSTQGRTDLSCRTGDVEVTHDGTATNVSMASEGCRVSVRIASLESQVSIFRSNSFWLVDAPLSATLRARPPALSSVENILSQWESPLRPGLHRPAKGPIQWSVPSSLKNCALFKVAANDAEGERVSPAPAFTGEGGSFPAELAGDASIYLRCELEGSAVYSDLVNMTATQEPPAIPPGAAGAPPAVPTAK